MNTLDWKKLEAFIEERKPVEVSAGLLDDWFWTASTVYEAGEWTDREKAYVTSSWATPGFEAVMDNGDIIKVAASRPQTDDDAKADKIKREKSRKELREMVAAIEERKS